MPNLWNYFKNLFNEVEQSSPSHPLIHEMIERSDEEKQRYERWKNTLARRRLQDWLKNQYAIYKVLPEDIDEAIDFLDTPSSKGFVIHFFKTQYAKQEVQFLFDLLKEQVLKETYRTQISDRRTYNRPNWVETVERHYLKPRPQPKTEGKLHQQYGNVTIELLLRNDQVYNLKFRANSYRDHLFHDAIEFEELLQKLFD